MKKILSIAIISILITQGTICQQYTQLVQSFTSMLQSENFRKDLQRLIKKHVQQTPLSVQEKQDAKHVLTLLQEYLVWEPIERKLHNEYWESRNLVWQQYQQKEDELRTKLKDTTELYNQLALAAHERDSQIEEMTKTFKRQISKQEKFDKELELLGDSISNVLGEDDQCIDFLINFFNVLIDAGLEALPSAATK